MKITVNGEAKPVEDSVTVADLVRDRGSSGAAVAVAVNMTFVPRSAHATTKLKDGDDVEIVEPRQGG